MPNARRYRQTGVKNFLTNEIYPFQSIKKINKIAQVIKITHKTPLEPLEKFH